MNKRTNVNRAHYGGYYGGRYGNYNNGHFGNPVRDHYSSTAAGSSHAHTTGHFTGANKQYNQNPYAEDHVPFYRRNDGYDNYYGSDEDDTTSKTSKVLSVISEAGNKLRNRMIKKPAAQSSNVCYERSVHNGQQYEQAGIKII